MPGPAVFRAPRLESPLHTETIEPHGEVLASEHGVLGRLLRHGQVVDSTLKSGEHLLSVDGYHYVFKVLSEADRGRIHAAYGIRGNPVFLETLRKAIKSLKDLGASVEHRVYSSR